MRINTRRGWLRNEGAVNTGEKNDWRYSGNSNAEAGEKSVHLVEREGMARRTKVEAKTSHSRERKGREGRGGWKEEGNARHGSGLEDKFLGVEGPTGVPWQEHPGCQRGWFPKLEHQLPSPDCDWPVVV